MTWWKNLFIAAYLMIQVTLPLRGCLYEKFETRGNFSWNMYAYSYECTIQYRVDTPEGETLWPKHKDHFKREGNTGNAFFSDNLPEFHRWLCDKFRYEGKLESMQGYVICSLNGGPYRELVDRSVDLCTALNYGVRAQPEALKK